MTNDIVKRLLGAMFTFKLAQSPHHEVQHLSDLGGVSLLSEDLAERLDEPRSVLSVPVGDISISP